MLARDLGRWNVDALAVEMPNRAMNEWIAYYDNERLIQKELQAGKTPENALETVRAIVDLHKA